MAPAPDELITGPYLSDACASSYAPDESAVNGVMAAATEYDPDATVNVDHAADTGLGGGEVGGCAAREGVFLWTVLRLESAIG